MYKSLKMAKYPGKANQGHCKGITLHIAVENNFSNNEQTMAIFFFRLITLLRITPAIIEHMQNIPNHKYCCAEK